MFVEGVVCRYAVFGFCVLGGCDENAFRGVVYFGVFFSINFKGFYGGSVLGIFRFYSLF